MGGASAFHRPVTESRRDTDRQIEGQRHTVKACDLLMGPGMLVTACFGPKNGHGLCRWGTGKEVGPWGRGEAGRAGIFRQPKLGQSLRGRAKRPRVKHEEWHLLATSLHPTSEHQGVWAPPHTLCGQDSVAGGSQTLETKPPAPEVTHPSFNPQGGGECAAH